MQQQNPQQTQAQSNNDLFFHIDPPFLKYLNHPWVDSVIKTLTIDQQIAQCIWIAGYSNSDVSHEVEVSDIIRKYGVGGIVFFQGTAAKQAELDRILAAADRELA